MPVPLFIYLFVMILLSIIMVVTLTKFFNDDIDIIVDDNRVTVNNDIFKYKRQMRNYDNYSEARSAIAYKRYTINCNFCGAPKKRKSSECEYCGREL
jgi:hypothetical protein